MDKPDIVDSIKYNRNDVDVLSERVSFDGFFKIKKLSMQHRLFSGDLGKPITRELFVRDPVTCMLPYDPLADAVVLCEQFRVGALNCGVSPWLLEIVAGINDADEAPQQTARREAQEEAGLQVGELELICEYYPSPGGSDEWVTLFCGQIDSHGVQGVYGLQEEGEDIRLHVVPREDAFSLLTKGRIINAASIISLQWLQLNYPDLQKKWLPKLTTD